MIQTRQSVDHSATATADGVLAELLEQIASQLKAGKSVSLDEIVALYPQQEAEIRSLYPTIATMVQMAEDSTSLSISSDTSLLEASSLVASPGRHRLGDFQLIREVGRGGMGVVYEAQQLSLGRRVAVKVLPFAAMLDERMLKRFQNEARSAATLEHAHIVSVHFIGCERGIHFFAMQFVDGVTLEEVVRRLKKEATAKEPKVREPQATKRSLRPQPNPPSPDELPESDSSSWLPGDAWESDRRRLAIPPAPSHAEPEDVTASFGTGRSLYQRIAQLAAQAADAIEHAHQQRIIHRDIKPSNLMLDEQGQLWVTDFGLATTHGDSNLTLTGDLMGTLRYSSPEQARGGAIDHRTDIYSLGITLYELLALQPAFDGQDRQVLLNQILHKEPRPLRQVKSDVPRDLAVIVHKAISKEPQERYQTARELGEDLRRFLSHQPIKAKPPLFWELAAKWVRRRPGVALVAVFASLAAIGVSIVLAGYTVQLRWANAQLNELNLESLIRESKMHRTLQYPSNIGVAAGAIQQRDFETGRRALTACIPFKAGIANPCGFEWHLLSDRVRTPKLKQTFAGPASPLLSITVSPDGNYAATGDQSGIVSVWDLRSGKRCKSWRPFAGETRVQFSPRGTWLAAGSDYRDGRVILWTMEDFKEAANFVAHDGTLYALAFSADEKLLATGGREEIIKLWNLADVIAAKKHSSGPPMPVWQVAAGTVIYDLKFGPDGHWLISAEKQERLRTWNTADGSPRKTVCHFPNESSFQGCVLLDKGSVCAAGGYSDLLHLYDLAANRQIAALDCQDGIHGLAVSPDDQTIAAGCDDGSVLVWKFSGPGLRQMERICFVAHQGRIRQLAFSPDGRSLLTAGDDGFARVWDLSVLPAPDVRLTNLRLPGVEQVRYDPTGKWQAVLGRMGSLEILDAVTGSPIKELTVAKKPLSSLCFEPSGKRLAATAGNEVFVWSTADWSLESSFIVPGLPIRCISFGEKGLLHGLTSDGEKSSNLQEWTTTGKLQRTLDLDLSVPNTALLSPDSKVLAVSTEESQLLLIDLAGFQVREVPLPTYRMVHLAFSRDGKSLAAASQGNTFCLIDVSQASRISYHGISASDISGLAFMDEGRLLAISDHQQKCVHFWDLETTRGLFSLDALRFEPRSLALSPDGRFLVAATRSASAPGASGVLTWDLRPPQYSSDGKLLPRVP